MDKEAQVLVVGDVAPWRRRTRRPPRACRAVHPDPASILSL